MKNEMQSLNERIAEKVGNELFDLIPEDQWKTMIDAQIHQFKTQKAPAIIRQVLEKELRVKMVQKLYSVEYGDQWDNDLGIMINAKIQEILIKAAPEVLGAMLAPIMSGMMTDLRNRLSY